MINDVYFLTADIISSIRDNDRREIINIKDFLTTDEVAKILNLTRGSVCDLCRKGKLAGASRVGQRVWVIPKQSIDDYEPALRGFAAVQAKRRADAEKALAEQNAAIRAAKGLPERESEASSVETEYVNVEEAAKILNRSKRTVREYCSNFRIAGARKKDARGREWVIPKSSLKNILPSIGVIRSDGTVMPLGRGKAEDAEV